MKKSDIQMLKTELEEYRENYNSKYLDPDAPVTANDIEELARDVFYVFDSIIDKLASIAE